MAPIPINELAPRLPFHGTPVGIMMLERGSNMPFLPGDTGNATTWSVPVRYKAVPGLTADWILGPEAEEMTSAVVQAASELVREGAQLITCGCGYSIRYQEAVRAAVGVPVAPIESTAGSFPRKDAAP